MCFTIPFPGEDILETRASIAAFKGHRVTLPCKLTTTSTGEWMFIRWTRTYNDSVINLANIQNNVFSANWAPGAPEDFRDHVELHKSIKDGEYSLDLIIDGFRCSDIGLYTCDVFTMTSSSNIVSKSNLEMKGNVNNVKMICTLMLSVLIKCILNLFDFTWSRVDNNMSKGIQS
jgi:hypothetical protein